MTNFAEAFGPYARQVRLVIPPAGARVQPRANVPGYAFRAAGTNWSFGDSGDGLGSTLVVL
jgi:hypothetical protein